MIEPSSVTHPDLIQNILTEGEEDLPPSDSQILG